MYPYEDDRQFDQQYGQQFGPGFGQQFGPGFGQFGPGFGQFGPGFGQFGPGFQFGGPGQFPPAAPGLAVPGQQPPGPPPSTVPSITTAQTLTGPGVGVYAVDPGAIRRCRFRYTFIWLDNGRSFWMWPTFVGRRSIAGFRWTGFGWVYYGVDLERIAAFTCF